MSYSGTLTGFTVSDEFKKFIEREALILRMHEVAKHYNESVAAYKITKKEHLRKAMKAKIETLYKTYQWLELKLNKLDEVTQ